MALDFEVVIQKLLAVYVGRKIDARLVDEIANDVYGAACAYRLGLDYNILVADAKRKYGEAA